MRLKERFHKFYYSFPVQLVVMQAQKSQLLLLYWVLLFCFVTQSVGSKYGIPYLFLDPEYMGKVSFISFFIMGICLGIFTMAFNISSYMLNSFRFPFLASLYKTFEKYSYNNIIVPLIFIVSYIICLVVFQSKNQLLAWWEISLQVIALLSGIAIIIYLTLIYFKHTNKDIYKLFGVASNEEHDKPHKQISPIRDAKLKKALRKGWHVETYITFPFKLRRVRGTAHYKSFMLESVFRQNHINAAVLELTIFIMFILLGLFRDYSVFRIPAGASVLLLFTMIIMIGGVFRYWLRAWANTAVVGVFLAINFLSGFEIFNFKNKAYGLDYDHNKPEYSVASMDNHLSEKQYAEDYQTGLVALNNWKKKWNDVGIEKPKLVVLNVSGGGVRSALFTFNTMLTIDSVLDGKMMEYTHLINGSSGGLIGASYYRELYYRSTDFKNITSKPEPYIESISKDILNATAFSFTISDLFLNFQQFKYNGQTYLKDRAYAFEQQLNENTGKILDRKLDEYMLPELKAQIPRIVICPAIINDGRNMIISPLPSSYFLKGRSSTVYKSAVPDGVDFKTYFKNQDAGSLRFLSALRMNATFPYIMPAAQLPSEPGFQVMDAGIRDNYGVQNSVRYLVTYRQWILENTSGVVFVQVRDNYKYEQSEMSAIKSIFQKMVSPFKNLSGNFIVMQDYVNDSFLEYLKTLYNGNINFVDFEMPQKEERISLSWHLTEKEKRYVINEIHNAANEQALTNLKGLLDEH